MKFQKDSDKKCLILIDIKYCVKFYFVTLYDFYGIAFYFANVVGFKSRNTNYNIRIYLVYDLI